MKRRVKLVVARIEAGIKTHSEMVELLKQKGVEITAEAYGNVESGRNKYVDVVLAFAIANVVGKPVTAIFLPESMQKMHQETGAEPEPPEVA